MTERKSGIAYVQVRMQPELYNRFSAVAEGRSHSVPEELIEIAKAWVAISERDRAALFLKAAEAS